MRRVQARQLLASILRCKPPLYARTSLVACPLPCAALPSQRLLVRDAPTEALTAQHRELDLHLVQPRAVLGRVVELQLGSDAPRLCWLERLVERCRGVGIEVVEHYPHLLGPRVVLVHQRSHLPSEVHGRATLAHVEVAPSRLRLEDGEQVGRAPALVLVVVSGRTTELGRQGGALLGHHLVGYLVEADHRALRIVALLVEVEHVLHAPDELRADLGDAPLPFQPRFEVPFLSVLLTVSSEISSATPSSSSLSANSRMLQRLLAASSGGSEQAKATR